MIKEEAMDLMKEKLSDISYLLQDLDERLNSEIEKRLEDWEKETN